MWPSGPDSASPARWLGGELRLAEEGDLAGVELRFPDGRAWGGEGGFAYVREAVILGASAGPG